MRCGNHARGLNSEDRSVRINTILHHEYYVPSVGTNVGNFVGSDVGGLVGTDVGRAVGAGNFRE